MQTKQWTMTEVDEQANIFIEEAAQLIREGELIAFPTETVYGLGADAVNEQAVQKIFQAKQRPADNPLIAHVSSVQMIETLVKDIPPYVKQLIKTFSPGPLTYVLKSNGTCADSVTAGLETVAVRIPDHPIALALINTFGRPIAAPSANLSGRPSPVTADHVCRDLSGAIAGILDGGPTGIGVESTVVDCTKRVPEILRYGAILEEDIQSVVGDVIAKQTETRSDKYKHYQPEVPIWLVHGSPGDVQSLINQKRSAGYRIGVLGSEEYIEALKGVAKFSLGKNLTEIAQSLYAGFRHFQKDTVDLVIIESFPKEGIGKTIMNRIEQAATKII
ncbi:MAG TPA: L-threonylcarbamoyladenylate synthase [Bacillota bacterium]|nr:L-threonylcarbamoyladenylate synthase [Bacillota bacterium]